MGFDLQNLRPWGNGLCFQVENLGFAGPQRMKPEPSEDEGRPLRAKRAWLRGGSRQLPSRWLHRESQSQIRGAEVQILCLPSWPGRAQTDGAIWAGERALQRVPG